MTGRSSWRALLFLTGALISTSANSEVARAEVVKGQSRELGIQFEVRGGTNWCAHDIGVALNATRADVFKPDAVQFIQMLGRIRAIIMDQCPTAERIVFDGAVQQRAVMSIEMTRLTRWRRLIRIEPSSRRPLCPTKQVAAECEKLIDAYVLTHKLMRGEPFKFTELTSVLEDSENALAVWRSGEVTGKLSLKDKSEFAGRFATGNLLADATADALSQHCAGNSGQSEHHWSESWPRATGEETAMRGFTCRPSTGDAEHHALIVSLVGANFHVFALFASGADAQAARLAARDLALAIGEAR